MDTDPRPFRLALYVGKGLGQTAHNAFKIIITPLLGRSLVGHGMIHPKCSGALGKMRRASKSYQALKINGTLSAAAESGLNIRPQT